MSKNKKIKKHISLYSRQGLIAFTGLITTAFLIASFSVVQADKYEEKIKALSEENSQTAAEKSELGEQADSLSDKIAKIQKEINSKEAQIAAHQKEIEKLQVEIKEAEVELEKQKSLLSETIRAIYVEGDVTTVEMLASSDDLSDFFDKQQYRESVRSKVKTTLDRVNELKAELSTKKENTEKLLAEQVDLRKSLLSQKSEQTRLLSLNKSEQRALDSEIKQNSKKIAELRRQQAIENAKHFQGVNVVAGSNGRDTYPSIWRNSPQDSLIDSWGMYNRECVSYTAWKVYESGRFMPRWGGNYSNGYLGGNANKWDDNARRAGIPVDTKPRAGDVAVAHWGYYGHVMYVESVNSNGTINISQYNYDFNGTYSEAYNMSTAGLVFIHFK